VGGVVQRRTEKKEIWKRLNRAVICMIKFERRRTWEKFVLDLQEDYKGNKKLLYAVMRNKTKPKTELCSIPETGCWFGQKTPILGRGWNSSWSY
jgi:hypothetical protein